MIPKIKNQKKSVSAFTLIEMVIVLVIMGIMLMATLYLSGEQIQKVKDKTVKESILAEMQSRYSRNLWSSSFAWILYDTMDVTFLKWTGHIDFTYNAKSKNDDEKKENIFTDKFAIKYITTNYDDDTAAPEEMEEIKLAYSPYQISCKIWGSEEDDSNKNVVMLIRVNDSRDYCFEIQKKNCRLMEMSEWKCDNLKEKAHLK